MIKKLFQLTIMTSVFPMALLADEEPEDIFGMTGNWGGGRSYLHKHGIDFLSFFKIDDTWNLHGGEKESDAKGNIEYVFDFSVKLSSEPLFHYSGGTLLADFRCHHGKNPTKQVGSFVEVDEMEAPGFNDFYALWYQQTWGRYWFQVGKSDAYDHFSATEHSEFFINGGYTTIPTIQFMPTYPDPAMSVLLSLGFCSNLSFTMGVFDGSTAIGYTTGNHGIIGRFFNHLDKHAFLIAEADATWSSDNKYQGTLGIGGWKHTAKFDKINGGTQKGTAGPYATLDQVIYQDKIREGAFFFIYGWANPKISNTHNYYGAGTTWKGLIPKRPEDTIGLGMSTTNFSNAKKAEFTEKFEIVYEVFYALQFTSWGFLEPDYQYIVHPGGEGLSNASVFTIRLQFSF